MAVDRSGQRIDRVSAARWYLVLTLLSLLVLAPIYFLFVRAISDPSTAFTSSVLTPQGVRWDGFSQAWERGNLGGALLRSLVVTVAISGLQVVTSVLAAYAFAFLRFPFKRVVFAVFMATLLQVVAAIVSLGLAFGAAYPRVDTQNAAQIATGFGGLIYMVTCLGLIAAVIALEAWPVSRIFWSRFASQPINGGETAAIAISFGAVTALTMTTWALGRRSALKSLAHLHV